MAKKLSKPTVKKNVKNAAAAATKSTAAVKKNQPAVKKTSSRKTPAVTKSPAVKIAVAPAKKAAVKKAVPAPVKKSAVKKAVPVKKTPPASAKATVKKAEAVKPEKTPTTKKTTKIRKDEILKKLRLSKSDKKFFYDLLMHARAAFGAMVQYHSDDALTRKDAAGERAGMATHMADLGTDNYRRDFELGQLSDGVDVLEMIDEALQRLEDSEYGICLDCGEPIPRKRLEAKPYAKYCTKCKSKREAMDETFYHRR